MFKTIGGIFIYMILTGLFSAAYSHYHYDQCGEKVTSAEISEFTSESIFWPAYLVVGALGNVESSEIKCKK